VEVSRIRTAPAILAACVCLGLLWPPLARGGDVRVGDFKPAGSAHSYSPALAAEGDNAYAVWIEENGTGANAVYFSTSRDGGKTWTLPPAVISDDPPAAGSVCLDPTIAADGSNILAAWDVHFDGMTVIHASFSRDGGITWTTDHATHPQLFGITPLQERSVRAAVSGNRFYIVSTLNPTGPDLSKVMLHMSPDAGTTWTKRRMDSLDTGNAYDSLHPAVSVSGGTVFVAWDDWYPMGNHRQHIRYNASADGGATWLATDGRQLDSGSTPGAYFAVMPSIAAAGSNLYAAWTDSRAGLTAIYGNRSENGGATWLPADVLVSTGIGLNLVDSLFVQLAVSGTDVYCAWQVKGRIFKDIEAKNIFFNASHDNGAHWGSSALRLDADSAPGCASTERPLLAVVGDEVIAAWNSPANGNGDIAVQHSGDKGASWLPAPVRHDGGDAAGRTHSLKPLLVPVTGRVLALWTDTREGRGDIYARRFPEDAPVLGATPDSVPAGGTVSVALTGTPGQAYEFFWSYERSGFTVFPAYVLDLLNPNQMIPPPGSGIFDPQGSAAGTFTAPQPPGAGPHILHMQAVDAASSLPSNVYRITVD